MMCNKCGSQIPDRSDFCLRCGSKVVPQVPQQQQKNYAHENTTPENTIQNNTVPEKPKKSKKPLNIGIIAGIIILVGVLGFVGFKFLNKATEKEQPKSIVGTWYVIGAIDSYYESSNDEYAGETIYFDEYEWKWIFNEDGTFSRSDSHDHKYGTYELNDDILSIKMNNEDAWQQKIRWEDDKLFLIEYNNGEIGDDVIILSKTR